MKIVWITANRFGLEVLKEAMKLVQIDYVYTTLNIKKMKIYDPMDLNELLALPIKFLTPTNDINQEAKWLKEINPDYIIVAGWRQIISNEILQIPKFGVIGFHPSLLPQGRGSAPIINSLLLGLTESASTMFFYNNDVDSGDIIGQEKFTIEPRDYAIDVYSKYIEASKELVRQFFPLLEMELLPRICQDNSKATYFPPRSIKDNEITMFDSLEEIDRKVRAFSEPYLGAYIMRDNKKLIIERCRFEET